jgi:oxidase EvaA
MPEYREEVTTLTSALISDGLHDSTRAVLAWLEAAREREPLLVERVPLRELDRWHFCRRPLRLGHESGKFFSIEGIRTTTDYGPIPRWDQPIIHQPEIGILGILTRVVGGVRYYLMQSKVEPGNINGPQISPTLQATFSNYTRVHYGRTPQYLEYFTGERPVRVLVNQLQSEHASRFLGKRNRNAIVESEEEIPVRRSFRWMTLGEIKRLLEMDNVVNMSTRSVLSCIAFPPMEGSRVSPTLTDFGSSLMASISPRAPAVNTLAEVVNWLSHLRATYHWQVTRRGLNRIDEWVLTDTDLSHREARHFSVIGARIQILGREVSQWSQPLICHYGQGLNGLVTQKIDGILHFLIRACFYPGNREVLELGPTVSRSDYAAEFGRPAAPAFLELFRDPSPAMIRFSSVQSEEGGRFFQYQNRYIILEMPANTISTLPKDFVWLTLGQIQQLLPHGYFNIEARNLLGCLPLTH